MREPTPEQFIKDVANHQMTVARNDGIYRHLKFRSTARGWNQWFDLITWPGVLTIHGDMGTWTFSRVEDMFTFFRSRDSELRINADYWAEKLQGGTNGGRDRAKVWDEDVWRKHLFDQLTDYYGMEGDQLATVTRDLESALKYASGEWELKIASRDFESIRDGKPWSFDSCELPSGMEYAFHFI